MPRARRYCCCSCVRELVQTPTSAAAQALALFCRVSRPWNAAGRGRFAGSQAMHQLIAATQQVLHVEDHEVITGMADHFAGQCEGTELSQS